MKKVLEATQAALVANAACSCITLDREMLVETLDADTGSEGFGARLAASHPYLFASSPVFLAPETMTAMRAVVSAIEAAAARPLFRAAALAWAPPSAVTDFGPVGALMGYDFHLTEAGPALIEINTNAGGAFLKGLRGNSFSRVRYGLDGSVGGDGKHLISAHRSTTADPTPEKRCILHDKPRRIATMCDNVYFRVCRTCWSVTCGSPPTTSASRSTCSVMRCSAQASTSGICTRIAPRAHAMIDRA